MENLKCRVCSNPVSLAFEISNTFDQVSRLFDTPKFDVEKYNKNIQMYYCFSCGHYQIEYSFVDEYYEEYYMTQSHSVSQQQLIDFEISLILERIRFADRIQLLEIGSGDGTFLEKAKDYFQNHLAFEPSKLFFDISKKKNLSVINDYFSYETNLDKVSVSVSRQVLEHLEDPSLIMRYLYEITDEGGIGLIEVPNGSKIISNRRYYEIFSDHVNYFTHSSLVSLVTGAGFKLLNVNSVFNDDYLICLFQKVTKLEDYDFDYIIEESIKSFEKIASDYESIGFFGMGAKGQQIYHRIKDVVQIKLIMDNDISKVGKYPLNSGLQIQLPTIDNLKNIDIILLSALTYKDEIVDQLRKLGFENRIVIWDELT
jgi:SAM-dependent methyltransferase